MSKNEQPDGESGEEPGKQENDESHTQGMVLYISHVGSCLFIIYILCIEYICVYVHIYIFCIYILYIPITVVTGKVTFFISERAQYGVARD